MSRGSSSRESPKVPAANPASFEFVALRTRPVCFEAKESWVSIRQQGRNLLFPAHCAGPKRAPNRLSAFHVAVLCMNVDDPRFRQQVIPKWNRVFTGYQSIRRIPNQLEIGMVESIEDSL